MAEPVTQDPQAVQAHLGILQQIIQRMADNSAACKGWCIAIVSAILAVSADKDRPEYVVIAALPTLLFLFLDTYYLSLEIRFRETYASFVSRVHQKQITADELFVVKVTPESAAMLWRSFRSFAIWPFYGMLAVLVLVIFAAVR